MCAVGGEWEKEAGGGIPVKVRAETGLQSHRANSIQDVRAAQARMRRASAKKAGICYLEYESYKFTTGVGRTWEVYGSPVSRTRKTVSAPP